MPCINSSFELLYEQMEPNRSLKTSSQGLSAAIEVKAPNGLIYGSRTLFLITSMAGKVMLSVLTKIARALRV